jgi:radical SAM superfamily enzyme YgiQ (UPF0313 family)
MILILKTIFKKYEWKVVNMKILLVYPEYPKTYWSFSYALKFISKKASFPPLGLVTIAAILPKPWEKRLVDMTVTPLKDQDLLWADYVFISAMVIQKESTRKVIDRCKTLQVKTVAGGPLFTCGCDEFNDVDHLILGEGELTLPYFLSDLNDGNPKPVYNQAGWADLETTPVPLWDLVDIKKYASLNIQYSRGCPFNCEFCNITALYGHTPRTKQAAQLLKELDAIYKTGWRGGVFFVDDNFIGNKQKLKAEILPVLIEWMMKRKLPFSFQTEASINLADDEELMRMMVKAGFHSVFIGIETPNEDSLVECNKLQNKGRDLLICVKKIQQFGLQVQGGFIVGFDNDNVTIFNKLVNFIQESGIVTAMVGLLNAPKGTKLYERLVGEGRLLNDMSGDNTDLTMNFIPRMNRETLIKGYQGINATIYSPKHYYKRVMTFLKEYQPRNFSVPHFHLNYLMAFIKSMVRLGIIGKERPYYWKLVFWSLFKHPKLFPMAITFSIYGFHFRKVFEDYGLDPV